MHRYVDDWGEIIRMTERNFRRFLRDGAKGILEDPKNYGVVIGNISFRTIDTSPEDFNNSLEEIFKERIISHDE